VGGENEEKKGEEGGKRQRGGEVEIREREEGRGRDEFCAVVFFLRRISELHVVLRTIISRDNGYRERLRDLLLDMSM